MAFKTVAVISLIIAVSQTYYVQHSSRVGSRRALFDKYYNGYGNRASYRNDGETIKNTGSSGVHSGSGDDNTYHRSSVDTHAGSRGSHTSSGGNRYFRYYTGSTGRHSTGRFNQSIRDTNIIIRKEPDPTGTRSQLGQEINRLNKKIVEAFENRNFLEMATFYSSDVKLMPNGLSMQQGQKAVTDFYESNSDFSQIRIQSFEVWGPMFDYKRNPFAIERGIKAFVDTKGKELRKSRYIAVWQKIGRNWKVQTAIWNMDGDTTE